MHAERRELQYPASIGQPHKMPGWSQDVGSQNLPVVIRPIERSLRIPSPCSPCDAAVPTLIRQVLLLSALQIQERNPLITRYVDQAAAIRAPGAARIVQLFAGQPLRTLAVLAHNPEVGRLPVC